MTFTVIIPARYDSSRLPGKPLLDVAGKPLIHRVFENAVASGAGTVIVATDDERIRVCAEAFGATVCMTSPDHPSGTDRVAEAAALLGEPEDAIVVNLQGDEPLIPPKLIRRVADLLHGRSHAMMATPCTPIVETRELFDPNVVKVVLDQDGYALYFSRAPIPWDRDGSRLSRSEAHLSNVQLYYRHFGLYAYRAGSLRRFSRLPACSIETTERLEQLRALYYGFRIAVAITDSPAGIGVDTQQDLDRVRAQFENQV